ncbi:hypothetical protein [Lysinibacillus capsici]|uniref:hypothetical protein n=1 Tax=Lysinibacillus capsici TaxID=2115968 RepID=UPI000E1FDAB1|nr:hypothetical protein [Lysinibacillus capsici]RDV27663.1 hypothetical protein C7B89_19705 [Lysinibacillus capsici]
MAVAILYLKESNTIHDFHDNIVVLNGNRLEYAGGYVEGWRDEEVGVIITEDLTLDMEIVVEKILNDDGEEIGNHTHRIYSMKDAAGNAYVVGDEVPEVVDIKDQYVYVDKMSQRIADLELMIAELIVL